MSGERLLSLVDRFNAFSDNFWARVTEMGDAIHIGFFRRSNEDSDPEIPVFVYATHNYIKSSYRPEKYRNVFAGIVDQGRCNESSLEDAAINFFKDTVKCRYITDEDKATILL